MVFFDPHLQSTYFGTAFRLPGSEISFRIVASQEGERRSPYMDALARAVLSVVHNEGRWSTKYSVICDLMNAVMYIYYFHDFEEVYVLDLKEELKKGRRRFPLRDLFSEKWQERVWAGQFGSNERSEEGRINRLGYDLLGLELFDEAVSVFKKNTERFPESWNVWDSLAEAYLRKGDMRQAIEYYKKSIEINPENDHGRQMLKEIEK